MMICVNRYSRHAGAVDRDAVAQPYVAKVTRRRLDGEPLAVVGGAAQAMDGDNAPDVGDDSSKHPIIFAG